MIKQILFSITCCLAIYAYADTTLPVVDKNVAKATKKELKAKGLNAKDATWQGNPAFFAYDKDGNFAIYSLDGQQLLPLGQWGNVSLVKSLPPYHFTTSKGLVNSQGDIIVPSPVSSSDDIEILGEGNNGEKFFKIYHPASYVSPENFTRLYTLGGTLLADLPDAFRGFNFSITSAKIGNKNYYFLANGNGVKMLLDDNFKTVVPSVISIPLRGIDKKPVKAIRYLISSSGKTYFFVSASSTEKDLIPVYSFDKSGHLLTHFDSVFNDGGEVVFAPGRETSLWGELSNGYLLFYEHSNRIGILTDPKFSTVLQRRDLRVESDTPTLKAPNERFTFKGKAVNQHNLSASELALAKEHANYSAPVAKSQPTVTAIKTKDLPSLEIVDGSIKFIDPSGRNAIEAGGAYTVEFTVRNSGKGSAEDCTPQLKTSAGLTVAKMPKINIPAGGEKKITARVTAADNIAVGKKSFAISVDEPHGFGTDSHILEVNAHAFTAPKVIVNDFAVSSPNGTSTLQRKLPFDLQILLQNVEAGNADNVVVTLELPANVLIVEGEQKQNIARLKAGETHSLNYTLVANNSYTDAIIPVKIKLSEKHGKYAEGRTIELTINQALAATKTTVSENAMKPVDIQIASLTSEVDRDIPNSELSAPNTFAVIISNENYSQVDPVDYAINDGQTFARYCTQVLGLPESNVRFVADATRNQMVRQLNWLKEIGNSYGKDATVIFYYSGHGVPSESDHTAYILPVDGDHADMSTNLSLEQVYNTLAETGVSKTTVFLDACFSGSKRGDAMLKAARGVRIKPKDNAPKGPMVVLSAAQGDQTAYPLDKERHGMFTFYLLKKLRDTAGKVTLGELADYVSTEVSRRSVVENSKPQTPAVQVSPSVADSWRNEPITR